jgi:hypothetical protein
LAFILESQLVLVCACKRRKVEGIPVKNKINATISITVPTSTPTPNACRKLETYPNSSEQMPAMLDSGMENVAMNMEM